MKDRVLGVLFMACVFALLGMGVREYLIHNGRLTSDLNADGHSITNLPDGFFPTNGFLRTHQDISGKADKSDTYTKSETDAKVAESALPASKEPTSEDRNIGVNTHFNANTVFETPYNYFQDGFYFGGAESHRISENGVDYPGGFAWWPVGYGTFALTGDIPPSVSNVVTKAYVESLGIESGLQSESDPHVGLTNGTIYVHGNEITPLTEHQSLSEYAKLYTVSALANFATNVDVKASTAISYLQGDDAKVVITNYDSSVSMPSMSFQQRIDEGGSNWWKVVWNELTRWEWLTGTYLPANYYGKSQIDVLLDEKADRAWGYYDSHGGNYAPDGYTWISSPKIAIAAGLAYQRTVTSGGAIWVLESNGLVTETGGNLTNGFFRVSDDEGNSLLEIVKGNKRTIGANAEQPAVSNIMGVTHMYIRYSVVSESHPTLNICTALELGDWHDETSADCAANVSWTGSSGAYVAEVWGKTALTRMFVKAEYEVGGETYIKNSAPISADGGIYCTDGIHKVRFVYNNGSVTMEVTP